MYFPLSVRKKSTSATGNWSTTTAKDTAISWPAATMAEQEPVRRKTKRKWWKPKNNSMKSNESSISSTRSYMMSCPPCTILECCFWSPICNRISPLNNCFIANRQRYVCVNTVNLLYSWLLSLGIFMYLIHWRVFRSINFSDFLRLKWYCSSKILYKYYCNDYSAIL